MEATTYIYGRTSRRSVGETNGVQKNCPLVLLLPKKPCGPFKRDSTNRKADEILRRMTRCYIEYFYQINMISINFL